MFGSKITKTIFIEGMSCGHCAKKVEGALKSVKGVKCVSISLQDKKVSILLKADVDNNILKTAIEELGFEVVNIKVD